jgi:hypothetical protein
LRTRKFLSKTATLVALAAVAVATVPGVARADTQPSCSNPNDAMTQGYCSPTASVNSQVSPRSPVSPPQQTSSPHSAGAANQHTLTTAAGRRQAFTPVSSRLPFTGIDLVIFAVVAVALVACGLALRATPRD